jgi:hypothetical protein
MNNRKGAKCSVNGKNYELQIYNIVKKCKLNDNIFNKQSINDLGGSSYKNDIECIMNDIIIPIEIKKNSRNPDWTQLTLIFNNNTKKWIANPKSRIPDYSRKIFENLISKIILFNGNIPPFMLKKYTHSQWIKIKKETDDFDDDYILCPPDTIKNLYKEKGCKYIQISDKGLYHLGEDICNFEVPEFICEQQLRVRIKVHKAKNMKGYCDLSVTVTCQPIDIKKLKNSPYSLDDINKLPRNLIQI